MRRRMDVGCISAGIGEMRTILCINWGLTIESPVLRVAPTHSREANIHSAGGVSGSRLAAYRSFVENDMTEIKKKLYQRLITSFTISGYAGEFEADVEVMVRKSKGM